MSETPYSATQWLSGQREFDRSCQATQTRVYGQTDCDLQISASRSPLVSPVEYKSLFGGLSLLPLSYLSLRVWAR